MGQLEASRRLHSGDPDVLSQAGGYEVIVEEADARLARSGPKPAIGRAVRVLCGIVGLGIAAGAIQVLIKGDIALALMFLAFSLVFLGPAFFASGPPSCVDAAAWALRRRRAVARIQIYAVAIGLTGSASSYLLEHAGVSASSLSLARSAFGILIGVAAMLKFPAAYYDHYLGAKAEASPPDAVDTISGRL